MKALDLINNKDRIISIDVFRGVAIIAVVLYHFGYLSFGLLGVDLFFVISGLLVSRPLLKAVANQEKLSWGQFFLSRGFKIWPSYYFFILAGLLLATFLFKPFAQDQVITLKALPQFLFFYRNYSPPPHFWSFDHVWSLCVEEHFYILLPLGFVCLRWLGLRKQQFVLAMIMMVIGLSLFTKFFGYFTQIAKYTNYTHNRIDAMGLGVLISYFRVFHPIVFQRVMLKSVLVVLGIVLLALLAVLKPYVGGEFYKIVLTHSLAPIGFAMLIFGLYDWKNHSLLIKVIRFIAYFSYNWYLWHTIPAVYFGHYLGHGIVALIIYLVVSFLLAMVTTIVVEEKVLGYREAVLARVFKKS